MPFIHLTPDAEGFNSLMLLTNQWSGYVWHFHLLSRIAPVITRAFDLFLTSIERQYGIKLRVIETDNEITIMKSAVGRRLESLRVRLEASAINT